MPPDSDSSAEHGHRIRQNLNRPLLDMERLSFFEPKVGYRWVRNGVGQETTDYLEFISRVTSHSLDKERGHGLLF